MMHSGRRYLLRFSAVLLLCGGGLFISYLVKGDFSKMMWSDTDGYHQYLTAVFIHHDIKNQPYAYYLPDGTPFNRYHYGVALMQLPVYAAGFLYAKLSGTPLTGQSALNGLIVTISSIIWVMIGLILLFRSLKRHFAAATARITVLLLFLGTNLFYYTLMEPGLSHSVSFFLISWLVYRTPIFLNRPDTKNTLLCAIPLGLSILVRPTHLVASLVVVLYGVGSFRDLVARLQLLTGNWRTPLLFTVPVLLLYLPQCWYWHITTGKWLVYAYNYSYTDNETFRYLSSPKLWKVMSGVESGWLIYSPLMFLSIAGMLLAFIRKAVFRWSVLIPFLLVWYLNASWWLYTFACGFGYRILVDYYALLALTFGLSVQWFREIRYMRVAGLLAAALLVFINIRMSLFYQASPCWMAPNWEWKDLAMVLRMIFGMSSWH
ncbi:MAG TPA: hypothetical protein P5531_03270 [Bacteroidales bacterium]|nr:hypothetical protein [Bacteroidales bacterium]HSA42460.1 hypothetical protein [Bacteroidales bacterium]